MNNKTLNLSYKQTFLLILLLGIFSLFPNLSIYEVKFEESLRIIVSYEMLLENSFFQPLFLGEFYYNKPPLFNWLIILSSFVIPWSELTARIISIISFLLCGLLVFKFYTKLFKDEKGALFAGISFISFIDILYFYGYLAEIDITLTFFIGLFFYFSIIGFLEKNDKYIFISGILTGIAFLLKGLPSFVYFFGTYFALIIFSKRFSFLKNVYFIGSIVIMILIPAIWIVNTNDPLTYLKTLIFESTSRAKNSLDLIALGTHIISFFLANIKQLLPSSLFIIYLIVRYKDKVLEEIKKNEIVKILLIVIFINFIPYFIATESRGRYVLPIYPLVALVFGWLFVNTAQDKIKKVFIYTVLTFITLRFLSGLIILPHIQEHRISKKDIATDILYLTNFSKNLAFDCKWEKSIAVYINFKINKPLKVSWVDKDWEYLITCNKINYDILKEYKINKSTIVRVYKR